MKHHEPKLSGLYKELLQKHGRQGWWPLLDKQGKTSYKGKSPTKRAERFEICTGAILTQNTAWKNVEQALRNLWKRGLLNPELMIKTLQEDKERISTLIKPAGYYNQKRKKLLLFGRFFQELKGKTPSREALMNIWGIGPETADSILLYGYNQPFFVIDSYTRRVLKKNNFPESVWNAPYNTLQALFQQSLPHDVKLYKEFHALLVAEAKEIRQRKKKEIKKYS